MSKPIKKSLFVYLASVKQGFRTSIGELINFLKLENTKLVGFTRYIFV